jgi:hypothetical protein
VCSQIVQRGFQQVRFVSAVEHRDLRALRSEQQRRGASAQPRSKNGDVLIFVASAIHRNFSVASPSRAKMIERIQKRTMTVVSFQPVSSK